MANDANSPQKNTVDCQPPLKHIQEEENETIPTHTKIKEVCRVCEKPFTVKKDKHNLIIGAQEVKPPYTLALEELTGLVVETTDDLIAVCGACRNLLNRYHRSSCEAERIGTLVKSMSVAHTKTTATGGRARKRISTPTDGRVGKRIRIESLVRRLGFPKSSGCSPKPEPQSQPLPQPTALSSDDGAVRKTLVTMAPAVLHSQPVLSAVCSQKPGPQTLPQPTALSSDDGSVRKTLVNKAPAVLHSQPVLAAVSQTARNPAVEISYSRPQPQSESQHAPQPIVEASNDDAVKNKPATTVPVVWSADSVKEAVSQTARNPAVETSCSKPQPQSQHASSIESQHATQPTVQASSNEVIKKKPATTVPVVWSADSVKAAVSQTAINPAVKTSCRGPQPQSQLHLESQHAPQPTVQASYNAVKKKPATTVPVVWSADSVKAAVSQTARNPAVDTSCSRPQPQSQLNSESQHAPQPTVQTSDDEAAGKKPATTVPVVWSADSVKSAICSLKPGSQSQPLPQPTALSSGDGAVRKTLVNMAPAVLHSQPVLSALTIQECVTRLVQTDQLQIQPTVQTSAVQPLLIQMDGSYTTSHPGQSTPSPLPATTKAGSSGCGAPTPSASTKPPMKKQSKVTIRTAKSLKSRIVCGPMERVLHHIVQGTLHRIPHALLSVPGMFDFMVHEMTNIIRNECKKLTSRKFTSILRRTSIEDLKNFKWMNVVEEWRTNAPTFLKFLQCASTVSIEPANTTSRIRPHPSRRINKYRLPMAGAILLNARCESMSAHMYTNALVMCHSGSRRRFKWLNRVGVCITSGMALAKLKAMGPAWDNKTFFQWTENVCKDRGTKAASKGAEAAFTIPPIDTDSDESQDNTENGTSPEHTQHGHGDTPPTADIPDEPDKDATDVSDTPDEPDIDDLYDPDKDELDASDASDASDATDVSDEPDISSPATFQSDSE
ncbi:flocculation protein FLO11-like isoform X7 [Etheostoma cragini]|uniref:flocculation protein FLO11-like isoform X7 n=1 Tax=Etheostoma cragini TaxID=417921 RepID=UPI00155EF657|nr:flocculation protein FLO11-like isoform X7 [Etheostoma cragini]